MNDDAIVDLKQFIAALFSQHSASLKKEIVTELREDIAKLEKKMDQKIDDLSSFVAQALDAGNRATASVLKNHERRITGLERKVT